MAIHQAISPIRIHSSSRLEALLPALLERLQAPLALPLSEDWLLLPSQGLKLWLDTQIAQASGICCGINWILPEKACPELMKRLGANWPNSEQLFWPLHAQLLDLAGQDLEPDFAQIQAYLSQDPSRCLELAWRLAEGFEQYGLYRLELLADWAKKMPEKDTPARWQARLWRALPTHLKLPDQLDMFKDQLAQNQDLSLPARIQIFGCSQLPPFLLTLLRLLAPLCRVDIYVLATDHEQPAELHQLAALNGELSRALYSALEALAPINGLPQPESLPLPLVSIHATADPQRELEVLRDWLLDRFEADPMLLPAEIVIGVPQLKDYAGLVPLVFGREPALPIQLLGQGLLERSPLLQSFFGVLTLAGSRLARAEVLDLLESDAIARRFDLDAAEREQCRQWIDAVAIRWGWNAGQRQELTSVAFGENSWQAGIERLLLGYLLGPGSDQTLFAGIAPYSDIEGNQAQTLGKLLGLLEALRSLGERLRRPRSLARWSSLLMDMLQNFLVPDSSEDWTLLFEAIMALASSEAGQVVELTAVKSWLRRRLQGLQPESNPSGRILFGPLHCLQGRPAKLICLLGLNDPGFPRRNPSREIDLLSLAPRAGDPLPASQDRNDFWAALLAARQCLYLGFQGLDPRTGSELPPSVLLSELRESWPIDLDILKHRLHPHDPLCFDPLTPISFRADSMAQAKLLQSPKSGSQTQIEQPLPLLTSETLSLEALIQFWRNPAADFLRKRLGLRYAADQEQDPDSEALDLPGLASYQIRESLQQLRLIQRRQVPDQDPSLASEPESEAFELALFEANYASLVARSQLPVGPLGRIRYEELANQSEAYYQQWLGFCADGTPEPHPFELSFELSGGSLQLTGELLLWPDGLKFSRPGAMRPQDLFEAWLQHLVLQLLDLPPVQRVTRLLAQKPPLRQQFLPVTGAEMLLSRLLELCQKGQTLPLPWFPKSGKAYAEALIKGQSPEMALMTADSEWTGRPGQSGEQMRREWQACFKPAPRLDVAFEALAQELWLPLLQALGKESDDA
ncbi:MAG: hypothetical protein CVV27_10845 [Candidatus Melainabacteria bacterium HGW-Melainabacteria-1]|nr:MAG: hypothetical protein CVV27_10845 [Candidatus Melainabacteria bacterium HGW-Melainabacteria-1]